MKTILLATYIINISNILYYLLPFIAILLITCNIFYYNLKETKYKKITIFNFWNPYKNMGYDNNLYAFATIITFLTTIVYFSILYGLSKNNFIFTF